MDKPQSFWNQYNCFAIINNILSFSIRREGLMYNVTRPENYYSKWMFMHNPAVEMGITYQSHRTPNYTRFIFIARVRYSYMKHCKINVYLLLVKSN